MNTLMISYRTILSTIQMNGETTNEWSNAEKGDESKKGEEEKRMNVIQPFSNVEPYLGPLFILMFRMIFFIYVNVFVRLL